MEISAAQENKPHDTDKPRTKHGMPAGHVVTEGEKKFDRRTYTWIGYVANVLLSVGAVAFVERTPLGKKLIEGIGRGIHHVSGADAKRAEWLARKTFFLTGGFMVLGPMKKLEDKKPELIRKWNREIYGAEADRDPIIRQSEAEIDAAPKQTWASVMWSRVLALIPFYITYGALWDQKSSLSVITNEHLQSARLDATKAYFAEHPEASQSRISRLFNKDLKQVRRTALDAFVEAHPHEASRGVYIDRPIAWVSRMIGKGVAKLTRNEGAVAEITKIETQHPGVLRSSTQDTPHDSAYSATPYYFISEAITSAMVAWGVYVLTRVLGPIFDKNEDRTHKPVPWQPSSSAIPITAKSYEPGRIPDEQGKSEIPLKETPQTVVTSPHHQQALATFEPSQGVTHGAA